MSIHADSKHGFHSLLRVAMSSVAHPPWFAAPVEAEEDEKAITISFHVPREETRKVQVKGSDQSITLRSGRRREGQGAIRVCAIHCPIVPTHIEIGRSGDVLRVRIPKKPPASASESATPSGASSDQNETPKG